MATNSTFNTSNPCNLRSEAEIQQYYELYLPPTSFDYFAGTFSLVVGSTCLLFYMWTALALYKISLEKPAFWFLLSISIGEMITIITIGPYTGFSILIRRNIIPFRWRTVVFFTWEHIGWFSFCNHFWLVAFSRLGTVAFVGNFKRIFTRRRCLISCAAIWVLAVAIVVGIQLGSPVTATIEYKQYGIVLADDYCMDDILAFVNVNTAFNNIPVAISAPLYLATAVMYIKKRREIAKLVGDEFRRDRNTLSGEAKIGIACFINFLCYVTTNLLGTHSHVFGGTDSAKWGIDFLYAVNCTINPLMYVLFSADVRKTMLALVEKNLGHQFGKAKVQVISLATTEHQPAAPPV